MAEKSASECATRAAAIARSAEGTRTIATTSWIFGAARAARSSMRRCSSARSVCRLGVELLRQRRSVPARSLERCADCAELGCPSALAKRRQRLGLAGAGLDLGDREGELRRQRPGSSGGDLREQGHRRPPGRRARPPRGREHREARRPSPLRRLRAMRSAHASGPTKPEATSARARIGSQLAGRRQAPPRRQRRRPRRRRPASRRRTGAR